MREMYNDMYFSYLRMLAIVHKRKKFCRDDMSRISCENSKTRAGSENKVLCSYGLCITVEASQSLTLENEAMTTSWQRNRNDVRG